MARRHVPPDGRREHMMRFLSLGRKNSRQIAIPLSGLDSIHRMHDAGTLLENQDDWPPHHSLSLL